MLRKAFNRLQLASAEARLRALGVCPVHLTEMSFVSDAAGYARGYYTCNTCTQDARNAVELQKQVEIDVLISEVQRLRA
jgi:hypothetical protein